VSQALTGKHALSGDDPDGAPSTAPEDTPTASLAVPVDSAPEPPLEPPLAVPVAGTAAPERVTCPECGTVATVALTRREASDFCAQCDYPLFWTPSKILLDTGTTSGDSLRRLPGTSGRVTVGSVACPHCAEGNLLTAQTCVRCGGLMDPPAPEVVVAAPPPAPAPPPEPERRTPVWVWVVAGTTLVLLVALVVFLLTR
jgi:hypothetical protein